MQLAKDLSDLIHRYGSAMATAAEAVLNPRHKPGMPLPDLSQLEQCRSNNSGQSFQFYPSQAEKIAGGLAGLKAVRRAWLICEMGTGKSAMSLAIAWLLLRHKPYRLLVMCPGHLVRKWRREIEWLLPDVHCQIIRNFSDLLKFEKNAREIEAPMVAVVGKDTAKLGFDVDRPCAARRKMWVNLRLHSTDEMLPGDRSFREIIVEKEDDPKYQVTRLLEIAVCPMCGEAAKVSEEKCDPLPYEEYIANNEPLTCLKCGDRLLTNARGFRSNAHIDRYIQRRMKDVFDLFVPDEIHELAAAESIQGNTFGTLASACKYTLALTGTLIGGRASDLHAPLWRMSASLLNQRGFNIQNLKGSRISAIARNERSFVRQYGILEHQVIRNCRGEMDDFAGRVQRGASGRRKSYKTDERPRPGISPDLFNHFLMDRAVFMGLDELGPELPSLERILIPCKMDEPLASAYRKLDEDLRAAIKKRSHGGKGPPTLACKRVQTLDAYLDKPWEWEPIKAPKFDDNGRRCGYEAVAWPRDLGENYADEKDRKLVEIICAELKQGRRCCVYPQCVGVHDVRQKIVKLLTDAGVRTTILPDTVKPEARETWIENHVHEMDVLIAHPKRVMTGLDLIQFPSLIWYQVGYFPHVLRQASARAHRPTQTKPCKVFYLFYTGTIQEQAMGLMGEKEAASQALEGVFDCHALQAMMNGGKNDDILAALANSLDDGTKINAEAAWKTVTATESTTRKMPKRKLPRLLPVQGLLFDLPQFALAT